MTRITKKRVLDMMTKPSVLKRRDKAIKKHATRMARRRQARLSDLMTQPSVLEERQRTLSKWTERVNAIEPKRNQPPIPSLEHDPSWEGLAQRLQRPDLFRYIAQDIGPFDLKTPRNVYMAIQHVLHQMSDEIRILKLRLDLGTEPNDLKVELPVVIGAKELQTLTDLKAGLLETQPKVHLRVLSHQLRHAKMSVLNHYAVLYSTSRAPTVDQIERILNRQLTVLII
jgi:hypothetical protein